MSWLETVLMLLAVADRYTQEGEGEDPQSWMLKTYGETLDG